MRLVTVTKNEAGQRLDKLMFKYMNLAGKSFIYKMIRKKNIRKSLPRETRSVCFWRRRPSKSFLR